VEVVAGAHFYSADPISVQWDSSPAIWKAMEAPKYDLLGLMPCCRRQLRTVCELILRNPDIPAAVVDAEMVRFRR
jgi:sulfopyruvate decarboxylase TPP-binding subunit